jgi:hypothetical protein
MNRQEQSDLLTTLPGRLVIYREKRFIRLAEVLRVEVSDWGVYLAFNVHSAPELEYEGHELPTSFTVNGGWDVVTVNDRSSWASYAGWIIVYGDHHVERIRKFAQGCSDVYALIKFFNKISMGED